MTVHRLIPNGVEKPWGCTDLPPPYATKRDQRIGEIWFTGPDSLPQPLLIKYLFTSERLSVQVHPDDAQARATGLAGGKSEAWYVLDAQGDARLGIGLRRRVDADALRQAALDGSIEDLLEWKPVKPGDFYYIPAGTIHAIGGGITLVEVQQNNDITYRLYDYGRPRELHLDAGLAVSLPQPYQRPARQVVTNGSSMLVDEMAAPFALESRVCRAGEAIMFDAGLCWFIPFSGSGEVDGMAWNAGECWLIQDRASLTVATDMHAFLARPTA